MRHIASLLPLVLLLAACDATFHDLRPEDTSGGPSTDSASDAGAGDTATAGDDASADAAAADGSDDAASDDTSSDDAVDAGDVVVARGQFKPRDYDGKGTVELVRLADGSWELRLGSDFQVDDTPGPVVILTSRRNMGSSIEPGQGDKELGVLRSNKGADSYDVSGGPGNRRIAFIYCKPFGQEILRAIMSKP